MTFSIRAVNIVASCGLAPDRDSVVALKDSTYDRQALGT